MGASQPKFYNNNNNQSQSNRASSGLFATSDLNDNYPNLIDLIRHSWLGLGKLYVAAKYLVHSIKHSLFEKPRVPYFKLGILAAAMFLVFKEDLRFTLNLKIPTWLLGQSSEQSKQAGMTEFGLGQAQAISLPNPSLNSQTPRTQNSPETQVEAYIKRFRRVAVLEMQQYGIPASIKMAQAILESKAGTQNEAVGNNNHFGAPLRNTPVATAWESWRAHSLYLQNEHPELLKYGKNYQRWAKALEKSGYNPMDNYAQQLIQIIEHFQLNKLDDLGSVQ